jgi:hypothetical protein
VCGNCAIGLVVCEALRGMRGGPLQRACPRGAQTGVAAWRHTPGIEKQWQVLKVGVEKHCGVYRSQPGGGRWRSAMKARCGDRVKPLGQQQRTRKRV